MDKPMSDSHFRLMSFGYKFRDLLVPRRSILEEADIKPGFHILDYGCGPGSYSLAAAELVGKSGKVYALDIHPLAIQMVRDKASKRGLINVETIHSDSDTGLPAESLDLVLLYDTFHGLSRPNEVLEELHRVLKPGGVLSFNDHHMEEDEIINGVTEKGLFKLSVKGKRVYNFAKGTGKDSNASKR
jgi:ubiquinone/menaquinone biosynthesis C-methylase UbiE